MPKKSANNGGPRVENIRGKYWEEKWLEVKMKSVQTNDPEKGGGERVAVVWDPRRARQFRGS